MFKKRVIKGQKNSRKDEKVEAKEVEDLTTEKLDESSSSDDELAMTRKRKRTSTHTSKRPSRQSDIESKNTPLSNPGQRKATVDAQSASAGKVMGLKPVPVNIKTTTITDFQPDVCKDFLQTGYCGYGDTCKFLHVRDELKQKRPVEKDWLITKPKVSQEVPYRCVLCKEDYKNPVKTTCGHIYCQQCFMDRYKKHKVKCFICGKDTGGTVQPVPKKEIQKLTT